ncbi:unnamed protein product [Tenebrio molitor]|nr:unnamed protein product [Tenebrio molitor]
MIVLIWWYHNSKQKVQVLLRDRKEHLAQRIHIEKESLFLSQCYGEIQERIYIVRLRRILPGRPFLHLITLQNDHPV